MSTLLAREEQLSNTTHLHPIFDLHDSYEATPQRVWQQEQMIAEQVLQQLYASGKVMDDPWLQEQMQRLILELYPFTNLPPLYAVVILNDPDINAFAVPGGLIGINTGLISSAVSKSELVAVLAHELSHIQLRHYSRMKEKTAYHSITSLLGLIAGVALAAKDPDSGQAVLLGSQAYLADRQLTFSRTFEQEADRMGIGLMAKAHYNPQAMASFFQTLANQAHDIYTVPEYLRTHPLTQNRVSDAVLFARQYKMPEAERAQDALWLSTIQNWIRVLMRLSDRRAVISAEHDDQLVRLHKTYQALLDDKPATALTQLQNIKFAQTDVMETLVNHLTVKANTELQRFDVAEEWLLKLPLGRMQTIDQVQLDYAQKKYTRALYTAMQWLVHDPQDMMVTRLAIQVLSAMPANVNKTIRLQRLRAQEQWLLGNRDRALLLLYRAHDTASSSFVRGQIDGDIAVIERKIAFKP